MNKVPELRFAGFAGEWEEKKLSKIAKFSKGKGYSKTDLKNNGNPLYLYGEMYTNYKSQINDVRTFTDKIKANSVLSKGNEVLIPSSGETAIDLARASHMNIPKVLLGGDLNIIEPTIGFDPHFLALELSNGTVKQSLAKKAQGKSVVHLYNTDIKNQKINYPAIDEQEKIGNLFKKIDSLIEIQEGKVSKLEDFKKSMLQKMFPKEDELVPEFRFDGFDEEWEELSIGDKCEVTMGQSPKSENYTSDTNLMVLVQGNADLENGRVTPRIYTKEVTKTSIKGDILMTVRAPVGTLAINEYDVVIGRGVCSIKGNTFVYYNLINMNLNNYWNRFSSGSTFESINSSDIKTARLKMPSITEQEKIGNFFKNLDSQIETEKKLLDSYKMMKKSLLQKLFV